jgi:hypothetical protein
MTEQPTLFETEQQIRKDKVLAAAAAYLRGRSGSKRRPGRTLFSEGRQVEKNFKKGKPEAVKTHKK